MEKEIWKDIKGYEGLYQVSNLGNVKSMHFKNGNHQKQLKQTQYKNGYLFVSLYKNNKVKKCSVHRLVANEFLNNDKNLPQVNHKDENKHNNNANNLEWCDAKYNINYGNGIKRRSIKKSRKIKQLDLEGNLIKKWGSVIAVERELGIYNQNIIKCCQGKRKKAGNYKWEYM